MFLLVYLEKLPSKNGINSQFQLSIIFDPNLHQTMKKALVLLAGMSALDTATANSSLRFETDANLLTNGDFEQTVCKQDWCIFDSKTPNAVTGWTPDPQIEVGYGTVYNDNLGNDRVVELDSDFNSCIYQEINNIQPGVYKLQVIHAARFFRELSDCQFSIEVNGRVLKSVLPTDYKVQSTVLDLDFSCQTNAEVRLCGIGSAVSNSYGALIKEVRLTRTAGLNKDAAKIKFDQRFDRRNNQRNDQGQGLEFELGTGQDLTPDRIKEFLKSKGFIIGQNGPITGQGVAIGDSEIMMIQGKGNPYARQRLTHDIVGPDFGSPFYQPVYNPSAGYYPYSDASHVIKHAPNPSLGLPYRNFIQDPAFYKRLGYDGKPLVVSQSHNAILNPAIGPSFEQRASNPWAHSQIDNAIHYPNTVLNPDFNQVGNLGNGLGINQFGNNQVVGNQIGRDNRKQN